jgi:bacteriocin-like protein
MTSSKTDANVTSNATADPASSKDALLDTTPAAAVVLSDDELNQVSGGTRIEARPVNKAKTADKAFNAMSEYIRG